MHFTSRFIRKALFAVAAVPFGLLASPSISVDSADVNFGTLFEGSFKSVNHTFIIKNTGDSTLNITLVKPSCGCTSVGHDSIIAPGKTGKITTVIESKSLYNGQFKKYVTVMSNAKNSSELRLSLSGTIKAIIESSLQNIHLQSSDNKTWSDSVILTTDRSDLMVTEVSFKPYGDTEGPTPSWQSELKVYPKFQFSKIDKQKAKDSYSYQLKIFFVSKNIEPQYGDFIIKTNHPKMNEIRLNGVIDGIK